MGGGRLARGVAEVLDEIDPLEHVAGYPLGPHYEEKQKRLLANLQAGWEHAVSDLLALANVSELGKPQTNAWRGEVGKLPCGCC